MIIQKSAERAGNAEITAIISGLDIQIYRGYDFSGICCAVSSAFSVRENNAFKSWDISIEFINKDDENYNEHAEKFDGWFVFTPATENKLIHEKNSLKLYIYADKSTLTDIVLPILLNHGNATVAMRAYLVITYRELAAASDQLQGDLSRYEIIVERNPPKTIHERVLSSERVRVEMIDIKKEKGKFFRRASVYIWLSFILMMAEIHFQISPTYIMVTVFLCISLLVVYGFSVLWRNHSAAMWLLTLLDERWDRH